MNHKIFSFILVFSMISCNSMPKTNHCSIHKVDIFYVNFEIITPFTINCDEFFSSFPDSKKVIITDYKILCKLEDELKNLKLANESWPSPDTRIKLIVYKDNKTETYCIGQFTITDGNKIFIFSDSFKAFLRSIDVL